jgi:hypothetical protein
MSNPRQALEAVQALADSYRRLADELDASVRALTELVETGEFNEQRRAAVELAAPLLSPQALQQLRAVPSGAAVAAKHKAPQKPWLRRGYKPGADGFGLD